jgi:hypothetical protein
MVFAVFAVAVLSAVCFLSCSNSVSEQGLTVEISMNISAQSSSMLVQEIDIVRLRVYASDLDTIEKFLEVKRGVVSASLDIPAGTDRIFEMRAYDSYDPLGRLLYAGADTVTIGQEIGQEVTIVLRPQILLMCLSPRYQELQVGASGEVDVWIFEVDSLFGAAFRLVYDESNIRIDRSMAGDFLGDDITFVAGIDDEENLYVISMVRHGQDGVGTGVSGDGWLATVYFTALVPGKAEIALEIAGDRALSKPDLTPVDRIEDLVLDGATVEVRSGG